LARQVLAERTGSDRLNVTYGVAYG